MPRVAFLSLDFSKPVLLSKKTYCLCESGLYMHMANKLNRLVPLVVLYDQVSTQLWCDWVSYVRLGSVVKLGKLCRKQGVSWTKIAPIFNARDFAVFYCILNVVFIKMKLKNSYLLSNWLRRDVQGGYCVNWPSPSRFLLPRHVLDLGKKSKDKPLSCQSVSMNNAIGRHCSCRYHDLRVKYTYYLQEYFESGKGPNCQISEVHGQDYVSIWAETTKF